MRIREMLHTMEEELPQWVVKPLITFIVLGLLANLLIVVALVKYLLS